ncbi:unnamed protein product, partial [marine sediment metagenome]
NKKAYPCSQKKTTWPFMKAFSGPHVLGAFPPGSCRRHAKEKILGVTSRFVIILKQAGLLAGLSND